MCFNWRKWCNPFWGKKKKNSIVLITPNKLLWKTEMNLIYIYTIILQYFYITLQIVMENWNELTLHIQLKSQFYLF